MLMLDERDDEVGIKASHQLYGSRLRLGRVSRWKQRDKIVTPALADGFLRFMPTKRQELTGRWTGFSEVAPSRQAQFPQAPHVTVFFGY
jgi:hypothetical protein